jgi:NDP-sugar pyrophosphorylase family protein
LQTIADQDYWLDFGNPGDIMKVSKFLKNGLPNFSTNK